MRLLCAVLVLMAFADASSAKPIVIAHRGASAYLPEHTLESYRMAVEMGADFIEPDLVGTKDGALIARHENEISGTTDVAEKFPERKTTKTVDGRSLEGWFSEDFTLAEIKTLRAKERLSIRDQSNNGKFQVPTFDEILALVKTESAKRGRIVGVYPETKHPTYFADLGLALEPKLLAALKAAGLDRATPQVFIQSFEVSNLQALKARTGLPLIQLLGAPDERPFDQERAGTALTYGDMMTGRGLEDIAKYAAGVGPYKGVIVPVDRAGAKQPPTDFIARAHAAGLLVHPYTFRPEAAFQAVGYGGDPVAEYCEFLALGADGLFSDAPDRALKARDESCPMRP